METACRALEGMRVSPGGSKFSLLLLTCGQAARGLDMPDQRNSTTVNCFTGLEHSRKVEPGIARSAEDPTADPVAAVPRRAICHPRRWCGVRGNRIRPPRVTITTMPRMRSTARAILLVAICCGALLATP